MKATCIVTENDHGIHRVTFDKYVAPGLWRGIPNASGKTIKKSIIRRKRKERGTLQYELLEARKNES